MGRFTEATIAAALFIAISLFSASGQRAERMFADAQQYKDMSVQFAQGRLPVTATAPFAYRPVTPWLAAKLDPWLARVISPERARAIEDDTGHKGVAPFYAVNIVATLVLLGMMLAYLRCFIGEAWVRLLVVTVWMAAWHAPARYVYFNPVNIEPVFIASLAAGLLAIEKTRHLSPMASALWITPIALLATLCRESGFLIAAAFVASRPLWRLPKRDYPAVVMPALAVVLALAVARQVGSPAHDYQPWAEPLAMISTKPLHTWVLAWFFTFGPAAVAIIVAASGSVRQLLVSRPEMAVFVFLVGLLAFFGGTDTERILGWAAPVMLVALGRAVVASKARLRTMPGLVLALAAVQLASARLPWPIPVGVDQASRAADLSLDWSSLLALADKALVIDNYYSNLWSYFGSSVVHAAVLAFDLLFVLAVVTLLRRHGRLPARAS